MEMDRGTTPTRADADIAELNGRIRGNVIRPDAPEFDEVRQIRNGLIDRRPALIVQCQDTADVVAAVNYARTFNLILSIRGGGHNDAGNAVNDGGMVIDLSRMRGSRSTLSAGSHASRVEQPGQMSIGRRSSLAWP